MSDAYVARLLEEARVALEQKDAEIERLRKEIVWLVDLVAVMRDKLWFEANNDGGLLARMDWVLESVKRAEP